MLGFVKRYRELIAIVALLVLPFITYLAHAKQGRDLNALDRGVLWVSTPIQRFVHWAGNGLADAWTSYVWLRHVRQENAALRSELARLRSELALSAEARLEGDRLREVVGFGERAPAPVVAAPVIGLSPLLQQLSIALGKGSKDGVRAGMGVATADGVVGRITAVTGSASWALLIVDPNFRLPVLVQRSRRRATVKGTGELKPCQLVNALRTDDIEDGDVVVTSGTDGVFPKGLVVGQVKNVVRRNFGMFLEGAEVVPAVDMRKLEEVVVLAAPPRVESEAKSVPANPARAP